MPERLHKIPMIKRKARIPSPKRIHVRQTPLRIGRSRRPRPTEWGGDPLEMRAIPRSRFAGATLPERIVYKKLAQLIGETMFSFQRSEMGGRNFLGGYVLDFVIFLTIPPTLIEIQGSFWHQEKHQYRDLEKALALARLGYQYYEVQDRDIYMSDMHLETVLLDIVGRTIVNDRGPSVR